MGSMDFSEVVRAKCSPELKAELDEFAERFDEESSEIIRLAISTFLQANKDAMELQIPGRTLRRHAIKPSLPETESHQLPPDEAAALERVAAAKRRLQKLKQSHDEQQQGSRTRKRPKGGGAA